jgi:hypothetical protein
MSIDVFFKGVTESPAGGTIAPAIDVYRSRI